MRVTNNQYYIQMLRNIQRPTRQMLEIQNKLSSGKELNSYADDPGGAGILEKYRSVRRESDQFVRNINDGKIWISQTEASLDRLEENLIRAKSLAVQAANDSNSPSDRISIGEEVNQILEDTLSVANTNFRGKYLFAGLNTDARPYVETRDGDGNIDSVGFGTDNTGMINRAINENVNVQINVPGDDVFDLTNGPIASLINLRNALMNNNVDEISNGIDTMDAAMEMSLSARTDLGSRESRMETTQFFHESISIDYTSYISQIEDADYAELSVKLTTAETGYKAAISTTARIVQTSLVDLLT